MSAPLVQVGPSDGLDVTAPLLNSEMQASASGASPENGEIWVVTPLPKAQVSVIAFAALAEPVCVNFIFPFINEMIAGMSNGPRQLAFRSGIFFGCFSLAQFFCVYFWGTLSDRIGRKPVVLICLACGMISTALFGLSKSFLQALILRAITGASYGDVPAMGDITDSTNQARGFSFIPLVWAIGSTLAPLMGGFLSDPVKRFPDRFGSSQFLRDHPYALPCFVSAFVSLLAFLVIALFFRESLVLVHSSHDEEHASTEEGVEENSAGPTNETTPLMNQVPSNVDSAEPSGTEETSYGTTSPSRRAPSPEAASRLANPEPGPEPEPVSGFVAPPDRLAPPRPSAWKILTDPVVRTVLLSYFCLAVISTANDVIFALWMYLSVDDGGVGLKPTQIATALSAGSILQTLLIVFLFPIVHRKYGTLPVYRFAMALDVVLIGCYPIVHFIAQKGHHHSGRTGDRSSEDVLGTVISLVLQSSSPSEGGGKHHTGGGIGDVWKGVPVGTMAGIATMLVVKAFAGLTWGCNMILVTASAPTPQSLGAVNSLAQMAASFGRAIGPPIYSSIFALSMSRKILGGRGLIWIFMGVISIVSLLVSFLVREGEQQWRRSRVVS